ncbi:MAG: sporulation protein YabP [Eubacteriales bacterium]|nr:sporulation protein YabP [Eubacteriales bacterium]
MQKDYDDKKAGRPRTHTTHIEGREKIIMTGIEDVESFDETSVYLATDAGLATITGKDLHINRLNIDDGQLVIEGFIVSIAYEDKAPKDKGGFFGRLFS